MEEALVNDVLNQALVNVNGDNVQTLNILLMLTLISLLPSIIVMMTSFSRTVIVLSFLRNAMGLQQTPPNMVLTGIAIFLTLFIMAPVVNEINETAYQPFLREEITQQEAIELGGVPLKKFMLKQTETKPLNMFLNFSNTPRPDNDALIELPMSIVIPSFITSELGRAFWMGFLLYIPFLLIDIVVASTLMSMGMIMLPPAMISMPFKLLMFIILDGWGMLFDTLFRSFNL
ncbi:MAG: flagellar type III secretion system pore protein FliP [Oscillospiraceae bacterium]|nr:flagellar type III secretion system pore protein FliP [Oscillospiraceae bacterium]